MTKLFVTQNLWAISDSPNSSVKPRCGASFRTIATQILRKEMVLLVLRKTSAGGRGLTGFRRLQIAIAVEASTVHLNFKCIFSMVLYGSRRVEKRVLRHVQIKRPRKPNRLRLDPQNHRLQSIASICESQQTFVEIRSEISLSRVCS